MNLADQVTAEAYGTAEAAERAVYGGPRRGGPYDPGKRRLAHRAGRQRGCTVTIPMDELAAAGLDPYDPRPVYYRTHGFKRSANGHSVIVSLYREP